VRQDAQDLILEFARRSGKPVSMLDRYFSLISVSFKDLPFEAALRRLCRAADLDFVKDDSGYTVGLPLDLRLNFPKPDASPDETVDATYRCRRIDAQSLAQSVDKLLGAENIKTTIGPLFLTPQVESIGGTGDGGIKALGAVDRSFRTHDVGFSGKPAFVRRALALARKFDRPRKQVRVKVRIMQMSSSLARDLGINWMDSLSVTANEQPNQKDASGNPINQVGNIYLGRFTHSPITLNATLNAAEVAGKTKTLSNPTLLVLDGEKGFILSGVKYVYPKLALTNASGQTTYDTTEQKEGIYLQVGVQVGLDDDMTLTLYPQVTSLQDFQIINGAKYPIINTVEEQATVRALKGEVIVMGGLRQSSMTDTQASVPFLGRIPILGSLFGSDTKKRSDQELVFFMTPELVEDPVYPLDAKIDARPAS
jgi:type II secretory pathway component GspD/PulD (secretin)